MELNRVSVVVAFLAIFVSWLAYGEVISKTAGEPEGSVSWLAHGEVISKTAGKPEGSVVPVEYQKHYQLSFPNEMHYPPCPTWCPPCTMCHLPPPRRMGPLPPTRGLEHCHHENHPPHAPASPGNKNDHPPHAPASPGNNKNGHPPLPDPVSPANNSANTTQKGSPHKETAMKALRFFGDVLSTTPAPLPFIIFWTTGNLDSTIRFYSMMTLGSTALSSYGWLMCSVLQVSYKDKEQTIGIDAILVNSINWGILAFMFMFIVMKEGPTKRGMVCILGLVAHVLLSIILLQFPILRLVKSDDHAKFVIGLIAGILQGLSEFIPLILLWKAWGNVYPLLGHPQGPHIRNYKKMTIVSRGIDSLIALCIVLDAVLHLNI